MPPVWYNEHLGSALWHALRRGWPVAAKLRHMLETCSTWEVSAIAWHRGGFADCLQCTAAATATRHYNRQNMHAAPGTRPPLTSDCNHRYKTPPRSSPAQEASAEIRDARLLAPCFVVLAGPARGEGCIIIRGSGRSCVEQQLTGEARGDVD